MQRIKGESVISFDAPPC